MIPSVLTGLAPLFNIFISMGDNDMSRLSYLLVVTLLCGCTTGVPGEENNLGKAEQPVPGPQGPPGPAGDSFIAAWAFIGPSGQLFASGGPARVLGAQ